VDRRDTDPLADLCPTESLLSEAPDLALYLISESARAPVWARGPSDLVARMDYFTL
jgi:hypothetical protein